MASAGTRAGREDERRADMLVALEYGVHPMVRLTPPVREHSCTCGYVSSNAQGLSMHQRWCDAHPA